MCTAVFLYNKDSPSITHMRSYNHQEIEKKWQAEWESAGLYRVSEDSSKPKCYVLDMFPYPSGEGLHVGHPKGFIATDVYSRMKTMQGYNVLHPMGFDAFGLPAENYAIKMKVNPMVMTAKNVARYKEQLSSFGFNYDWEREVDTTDPAFYKWTQWIFLKMFEKGLAYESYEPINWCPACQTGLANEDLEDGKCERCGTVIEKKPMRQWVLKITDYADRMLADLDALDWPTSIKESQKNWIGRSEGAEIDFKIKGSDKVITVFTTRPDTLFGATYVVLAPEHALVDELSKNILNSDEVLTYKEKVKEKTEIERTAVGKEKTGVRLNGVFAINPANGEELPVYVADYVLGHYGTGAVMAVPAHDERDYEFAKKYSLPTRHVVVPRMIDAGNPPVAGKSVVSRRTILGIVFNPATGKYLALRWKKQPWTTFITGGVDEGEDLIEAAKREILEETGYKNLRLIRVLGGPVQAEFFAAHKNENRIALGTSILFELQNEEKEPVSEKELEQHEAVWLDLETIVAEKMRHAEITLIINRMKGGGETYVDNGVLIDSGDFSGRDNEDAKKKITDFVKGRWVTKYRLKDWVFSRQRYWGEPIPLIHCEKCGIVPVPEKDLPVLLPQVESYAPTGTGESPLVDIAEWVNTVCPNCGGAGKRETNTMPQWAGSSWYYLRYIDPKNNTALVDKDKEKYWSPVDMYVGGAEHATRHLIYARFYHKFLYDIGVVNYEEPFKRLQNVGLVMAEDGRKMSKRWGNVVNPDDIVDTYGADTLRLYEMFMGPFGQAVAWNTESIVGPRRFLERVWRLREKIGNTDTNTLDAIIHKTIKKVGEDIESFSFNTAISSLMILVNEMEKQTTLSRGNYGTLLILLAPFAPHITEELWHECGNINSIHLASWPTFDTTKCTESEVTIVIQINGKVRDTVLVAADVHEDALKEMVLARPTVLKWTDGKSLKKIVVVKGRVINIVLTD